MCLVRVGLVLGLGLGLELELGLVRLGLGFSSPYVPVSASSICGP
jgi:hypothetical protein